MKIPRKPYRSYGSSSEEIIQQRKDQDDFKAHVMTLLDALAPRWSEFIKPNFTDDYFVINQGTSMWGGKVLARWKRETEFVFDAKRSQRVKEFVENAIAAENAENEHGRKFKALLSLVEPILIKYSSDTVEAELNAIHQIKIEKGECSESGYFHSEASILLISDGTITTPTKDVAERCYTLEFAQKFIAEFQPIHDELIQLAEKIKSELPREFWEK